MNEKISIIIPIYNAGKYLKQTLNSIRVQTYQNLEILCILDAPKDNSAQIVAQTAEEDRRIKTIEFAQNTGPARARNVGVENSTGEYIHFMDSDDLINPGFYEKMLEAIRTNDADVSACSVFFEKKPKRSIWFYKDEVVTGEEKIKKTEVTVQGWAWRYLIKKKFWIACHLSFPDLLVMEDSPAMIPMIYNAGKVALCSQAVYFYKNRENSVLNKKDLNGEGKERRKKDRQKSREMSKGFMRAHKIRGNSRLHYLRSSLAGKMVVCKNDPAEYGKPEKRISVIIPVYNAEKHLKETLDSVRFQTYGHLEIVCVLDAPTDRSAGIVAEAARKDSRIKPVEHSENMGLPAARNSGVENATGEYIHFMDADDLLNPEFYEMMIGAAEKAEADVAACSVFYEKKPWRSIWFTKAEVLSETADKIGKTEVVIQSWAWRYLIKKSFWEERRLSFPDLVPMEDRPVMIPMIYYAGRVALCPHAVYFYKNREDSILNRKYDPVREKQRSENRRKARESFKDFMNAHQIKRPGKLLYYIKKFFA
ncbi:MAG: glycosyltransferase [Bacteroidales bacterium]|jgi:glycosyltransferase involved in cell wall biosynthesis|nr:glycosyltransferase [Bacteroidales bacterium]